MATPSSRSSSRSPKRSSGTRGGRARSSSTDDRAARKERTAQSLRRAALELSADRGFANVSLREVTKAAGIVPTAFYRHYRDMDELGLSLVDEAVLALRAVLAEARFAEAGPAPSFGPALAVLARHVAEKPDLFGFCTRERTGGTPAIRRAIEREIELIETELALDVARTTVASGADVAARWSHEAYRMVAGLYVLVVIDAIERLVRADPVEEVDRVLARAHQRFILIALGAGAWRPPDTVGG